MQIPAGLVVGEDPELDAARFRRTERGICLITQPMIDRLDAMSALTLRVLSVASEVFPLVKTGGLADVVGALPAALAREGVAVRTLVPGYPGVVDALRDAETRARVRATCTAARRGCSRRAPAGSTCSCSTRRTSTRGRATLMLGPDGTRLARQRAALRGARARAAAAIGARRRRRLSCPTSCTRTTGRRASRRAYLHYGGAAAAGAP